MRPILLLLLGLCASGAYGNGWSTFGCVAGGGTNCAESESQGAPQEWNRTSGGYGHAQWRDSRGNIVMFEDDDGLGNKTYRDNRYRPVMECHDSGFGVTCKELPH